jgi:hypothetical protein
LQLRIAKNEPQKLNPKTAHTRLTKEEVQELDHKQSNPSVVKEETKNQDSRVDARGHLRRDAINELYN